MKNFNKTSFYVTLIGIHITLSTISFYAGKTIGQNSVPEIILNVPCAKTINI